MIVKIKPISVNAAWQGRRFKSDEYKQYESDFNKVVPRAKTKAFEGRLEIEFRFHLSNHGNCDYDNYIKCTQDLLVKKGYMKDDRYIYKATIYKIPCKAGEDHFEVNIKDYVV